MCLIVLFVLILLPTGCDQSCEAIRTPISQEANVLSDERAILIAKSAIAGKVQLQGMIPPIVSDQGDRIVVTFPYRNPPGIRGPDYDARVTINARTGEVMSILGSP